MFLVGFSLRERPDPALVAVVHPRRCVALGPADDAPPWPSDKLKLKAEMTSSVPWSKVAILGMVIPPLIGIHI